MPQSPLEARFWSKVNKDGPVPAHRPELGPCWVWTGKTNQFGYGMVWIVGGMGKEARAHRISWEIKNGEIPAGQCVLHKCDNPPCVNPDHLFLGTKYENIQDATRKGRQTSALKGEDHTTAKLTNDQVHEIRHLYKSRTPGRSGPALAKIYGVNHHTITDIARGVKWSHLPWITSPATGEATQKQMPTR